MSDPTKERAAELKREGRKSAKERGHKPGRWTEEILDNIRYVGHANCDQCGAPVAYDTHPPPNGIILGGLAIAVNCTDFIYLARLTIEDKDGHLYPIFALVTAKCDAEAARLVNAETDRFGDLSKNKLFSFGDGKTESKLRSLVPVSHPVAEELVELGIADYIND